MTEGMGCHGYASLLPGHLDRISVSVSESHTDTRQDISLPDTIIDKHYPLEAISVCVTRFPRHIAVARLAHLVASSQSNVNLIVAGNADTITDKYLDGPATTAFYRAIVYRLGFKKI